MEAEICICDVCGLVQTLPRLDDQGWPPSLSYQADFGGIRIGKGFRAGLETFQDFNPTSILDVGANRGAFYDAAQDRWPQADIVALEPDRDICRPNWLNRRIEELAFAPNSFDFIYCVHTLEHLPDPARELARMASWLKPTIGVLYLEVPHMYGVCKPRIEEFFIDRHLHHFSFNTLSKLVKISGLRIVRCTELTNEVIGFMCAKSTAIAIPWDNEAALAQQWFRTQYQFDFLWLKEQVNKFNKLLPPVAALGAGRIFHAFLDYGFTNFVGVYDDALAGFSVAGTVVQPHSEIPADATKIAFSRHIQEGVSFDA